MARGTKIRGITIELDVDTAGILDGFKNVNKSLKSTNDALKDIDKLLKFDPGNTTLLAQQQEYLGRAIEQTEEKLEKEKQILEQLQNADNSNETLEQQKAMAREIEATTKQLNGYKDKLEQTDQALEGVTDETQKAGKEALTFGDILKANIVSDIIVNGLRKLCDGIKDIASASLEAGSNFESSMSQVAATMGLTTEEIRNGSEVYEKLSNAAKKMGATTQFSASQAADALNYLALAGYDADKAISTLPSVLTLAAAGGMDLAYASDLVTDSMSALGLSTDELGNYIDEMAKAAQKSNTSVAQLGEAILVCGGTASLTDQSLEAMNAELGILANVGLKGAEGGTHLRNVLLALSAPTDKASAKLDELNVTTKDSAGNLRNLNDIMIDLNEALDGMGSADKAEAIKAIFNKTDIAAVNALLEGTNGQYAELYEQLENCTGAAEEMADVMLDNLKGNLTILKSALEGLEIAFYEVFDENAKQAVKAATDAVGELSDQVSNGKLGTSLEHLSKAMADLTEEFIESTTSALPGFIDGLAYLVENIPDIITLLEGLVTGYVAYNAALEIAKIKQLGFNEVLLKNPYELAAAAIIGLTAVMIDMTKETIEARNAAKDFAEEAAKIGEKFDEQERNLSDARDTILKYKNATKLTADEYKELTDAVTLWNSKASESAQLSQDATGILIGWTDAMENLIQAEYEEMDVANASERLQEVSEKRAEAQELLAEKTKDLAEAQEEYQRSIEEGSTATSAWLDKMQNASEQVEIAEQALKDLDAEYDILYEGLEEYKNAQDQANNSTSESAEAFGDASEGARTLTEVLLELDEEYAENLEKCKESLEGQRDEFAKLKDQASVSVDEIASELEKQSEGMKQYAEDIAKAEEIMKYAPESSDLLNYYISQGPQAAAELEGLISAWEEGGDALKKFEEACESFAETEEMIDRLGEFNEALSTGSVEAIQLATEGLTEALPEMELALQGSWDAQVEAIEEYKETMVETTETTVTDMADSITTNAPLVGTAGETMIKDAIKKVRTALGYEGDDSQRSMVAYKLGFEFDQSIADGMIDNEGVVATALQNVFDNAISALDLSALASKVNEAIGAALGG